MLGKFIRYLGTGDNFYGELDSDNVLRYLANWRAPRNKTPQYSNTGYALIGYILKHKTGEDIQSLASRYIFRPLHMANSSFTPQKLKGYPSGRGHAGDQPKFIPRGQLTPDWHFSTTWWRRQAFTVTPKIWRPMPAITSLRPTIPCWTASLTKSEIPIFNAPTGCRALHGPPTLSVWKNHLSGRLYRRLLQLHRL